MRIERILDEYAPLIDEAIRKLLPPEASEDEVLKVLGLRDGRIDAKAVQESFTKPAWDLISRGGKRWRAIMMMLTYGALKGDPKEVLEFSVIPELIHNGTLAVDDVQDRGELRRGKPCIHLIYGEDVAISMGNTLYYYPLMAVIRRHDLPPSKELRLLRTYLEEMLCLSIGQSLDIAWHRSPRSDLTEDHYITMCKLKTGSLVRLATRYACILADADESVEESVIRFSDSISVAFQIQDDVLNVTGDPKKYGKERGGDIKEGKVTLLVIHALRNLPADDRRRLLEILSSHTSDNRLIEEAISLILRSGAVERASKITMNFLGKALSTIDEVFPPSEAREALKALSEFLVFREF